MEFSTRDGDNKMNVKSYILILYKKFLFWFKWSPIYLRFILKGNKRCFNIFTHLSKKERLLLYKLALSLPKNSVLVEIGSYLGASAAFLSSAAGERNHTLYCVDTWRNDAIDDPREKEGRDTFKEFNRNINKYVKRKYVKRITLLRGLSCDMAKKFQGRIDLLFIDADHSYEGCRSDIESWLPFVKNEGIVVFHDYGWAEGIRKAVKEIIFPIQIGKSNIEDITYWARIKKGEVYDV